MTLDVSFLAAESRAGVQYFAAATGTDFGVEALLANDRPRRVRATIRAASRERDKNQPVIIDQIESYRGHSTIIIPVAIPADDVSDFPALAGIEISARDLFVFVFIVHNFLRFGRAANSAALVS